MNKVITEALKMFGKKQISKRLLVSSKVWMSTIPTHDCDVVLTLPANTQDTTLMWLLARLRSRTPRLLVNFKHHSNSGIYAFYMTASYESLLEGAEELGIRKLLRAEFGGGMKEFVVEDQECFEGVAHEETFLTSQERQSIVYHMLTNLRATQGEELENVKFVEGQPIVPRLVSKHIVSDVFPLHCQEDLTNLRWTWVQSVFSKQPLDDVYKYFGAKIGLYFVFLGQYTTWLVAPALVGILMFYMQSVNQWLEDVSWVLFSVFNVLWATFFLISWKRTTSTYSYLWGTLEKKDELIKDPRPLYKGDLQKSPITGRMEPYYPMWKRTLFRYFVSMPVIALFLCLVFTTMLLIFQLQEWVNELVDESDVHPYLRFGPKVLLALTIAIFDEVYKSVAIWLTYKENYRLEETHERNLVIKLVLFQFVNSFLSLFYIAFYLRDMDRLREQLAALLITRQIVGNLKEVLLPLLIWKARLYTVGYKIASEMSSMSLEKESERVSKVYHRQLRKTFPSTRIPEEKEKADPEKEMSEDDSKDQPVKTEPAQTTSQSGVFQDDDALTQAEVESVMSQYDDGFEDYLEMCLQFGYVTLFSSAFPLAALFALLNNVIEIRSDAFKLCYTYQRPFGVRAEDSGIWQGVLQVMALIAVVVNSALIGMGGLVHRLAPNLSDIHNLLLIIIFEHIILIVMASIQYTVSEVPHTIATEMAKVEFQRREALKRLESHGSSSHGSVSPRTKTPDIPDSLTASPPLPMSSHQSLVGHRPQNFSANHSVGRSRPVGRPSSSSPQEDWDQMMKPTLSGAVVDTDGAVHRDILAQESQIYRRHMASTTTGRVMVKRVQLAASKPQDYVCKSQEYLSSPLSASFSAAVGRSPSRETVSPQKETTFFASGKTVTYVSSSEDQGVEGKMSLCPSPHLTSPAASGTSVDIPRDGDNPVDP